MQMPNSQNGSFNATRFDPFGCLIAKPGENSVKVKIVINTLKMDDHGQNTIHEYTSEVWSGEMDILPDGEYLTKISIIAEGIDHPICDVPFSPTVGYWSWMSPEWSNDPEPPDLEFTEYQVINAKDKEEKGPMSG